MEPANWNLLGNYMKSAKKNVMPKDLKLDKIGDIETLHYPLACLGDIAWNRKNLLAFRHKKESTMLVKKTKPTDNCTTQSLTIINQRRSCNETARMISHGSNKHRPMHPSSNRTCFLRIWGICLLTLLVPNMLPSLENHVLICTYSKKIQNMCVYCENVRLSMENWPIWLHTVHQCLYILFNLAVSNGQIG